jgi:hypothetical protein
MRKRSSSKSDFAQNALRVVEISTGEPLAAPKPKKKNAAAAALGRLGGLKGGKARKEVLSPERRREIASAAARKRWAEKSPTQ